MSGTRSPVTVRAVAALACLAVAITTGCTPPAVGIDACPDGTVDDGGVCVPERCGVGRWGAQGGTDAIFVAPTGRAGAEGTTEDPLLDPVEAVARAAAEGGRVVALAEGEYPARIRFDEDHDGLALLGRCPERTVLVEPDEDPLPLLEHRGGELTVGGITLRGGEPGIQLARDAPGDDAELRIEELSIEGSRAMGFYGTGRHASFQIDGLTISDVVPRADGNFGRGFGLEDGAHGFVTRLRVERATEIGLVLFDPGAELVLEGATIVGTLPRADGGGGRGIDVIDGATLTGSDVVVEDCHDIGVRIEGAGTDVSLTGGAIRRTAPRQDGQFGRGVLVQGGAHLSALGIEVVGNGEVGIFAEGAGTVVDLADTVVADTQPTPDGDAGTGIEVYEGAALTLSDVEIRDNQEAGLRLIDEGTTLSAHGLTITGTTEAPNGANGMGLWVEDGATAVVRDLLATGNRVAGVVVTGSGASLDLSDAESSHNVPNAEGQGGRGIDVQAGAVVVLARVTLEGNVGTALDIDGAGTVVRSDDLWIEGTLRSGTEDGRGVELTGGALLDARNLSILDHPGHAFIAMDAGTEALWNGGLVAEGSTEDPPESAYAVGVQDGATLVATGVIFRDNAQTGLYVALGGARADLIDCEVLDNGRVHPSRFGRGLGAQESGSLGLVRTRVSGNMEAGIVVSGIGSRLDILDSTIEGTLQNPQGGNTADSKGIVVQEGATLEAVGLTLFGNRGAGLLVASPGTVAHVEGLRVAMGLGMLHGAGGRGVAVQNGAEFVGTGMVVEDQADLGLLVAGPGAVATIDFARFQRIKRGTDPGTGAGVVVQAGGTLLSEGLWVEDSGGPGLYAVTGGEIVLTSPTLRRNGFAGAVVLDGVLQVEGGEIRDSTIAPDDGGGVGVFVWNRWGVGELGLSGVTLAGHRGPAVYVRGDATVAVGSCELSGNGTPPWLPGGLVALDGVGPWRPFGGGWRGLLWEDNVLTGLAEPSLVLDASSGTFDVGDLLWQHCEGVPAPQLAVGQQPSCAETPLELEPWLEYAIAVAESSPE